MMRAGGSGGIIGGWGGGMSANPLYNIQLLHNDLT
jgi:hypothetical protein